MRLPDDDELYEVDQTYLGPPGRYIGVMRHKAIFAFLVVAPTLLVLSRRFGIPVTFLSVGLTLLLSVYLAMVIADHATPERPLSATVQSLWNDIRAHRPELHARHAGGPRRSLFRKEI